MKMLWVNKKKPWNWLGIRKTNFEKPFFFHVMRAPQNHWMWHPRGFAHINLFLISLWRDNANIEFGFGFGKRHLILHYHH